MKKFTQISFLFAFAAILLLGFSNAQAADQTKELSPVTTLVDKSLASGNLPDIINNAGAVRGASFDGEYIYAASRQDGDNVYYWSIENPAEDPQTLDLTDVGGGTFSLSDLTVANGHIFVSNMVFADGDFKVYHWADKDAAPTVLIDYENSPDRLGDAISVMGDPSDDAVIIATAWGSNNVYSWDIQNGALVDDNPEIIDFDIVESAVSFGRATEVPGDGGLALVSASGFGPVLADENVAYAGSLPADFFPGWAMYARVFHHEGERYLAYMHVKGNPDDEENTLYILDITEGSTVTEAFDILAAADFENKVLHSFDLGDEFNGNASVSLDILHDEEGHTHVFAYAAGNGFVLQQIGGEVPDVQPLPFVENFDGEGEDTPADWMPEGWLNLDEDGDGHKWYWEDYGDPDTEGYETFMLSRSFDGEDALDPDNWLISPAIYMGTVDEGEMIEMTFHVAPAANTPVFRTERYEVLISTTDNDPESFTMIWEETLTEETPQWGWQVRNLDLTDYAGETVHLAIRHYDSADNDRIALEKVEVKVVEETEPGLIYSISLPLEAGEVPYKYFVVFDEPSWEHGEWDGDPNRTVMVEGDMIVEDVWGDQPEEENGDNGEEDKENNQFIVTFKVDMADVMFYETDEEGDTLSSFAFDPEEHHVFIAGGFGGDIDWNEPGSNPDLELTIGDDGVVSVQEPIIEQTAINVFPNPARNNFTVTSESMIQQVVVSDITGRTVQSLQTNGHEVNLNASGLGNGVYIISVYTENGVSVTKLQVQQ